MRLEGNQECFPSLQLKVCSTEYVCGNAPLIHPGFSVPVITGSRFPSPEYTGSAYNALLAADYEMGFRVRPRSPYSQVFVVRHNPASPSNSLRGDESSGKRQLPFPPVTGETHLHHPKPRRLVGNIDDPNVTESDVNQERNGSSDSTTSGTEGYATALETQNESESAASDSSLTNDNHEEHTIQELVLSEPTSKPMSGVEAWEADLGETVKRIGGDMDDHDFKRGGSVASIGRKTGKHLTTPRGGRGVADGSKRGHILGLFDPPKEDTISSEEVDESPEMGDPRDEGLEQLEKLLHSRERLLADRERTIAAKEQSISEREQAIFRTEQAISQREQTVQRLEVEVEGREGAVSVQEKSVADRQALEAAQWSAKQKELEERVSQVEDRQRLLESKQKALEDQESNLASREERIRKRALELGEWARRIEAKEEEVNEKMSAVALAASESSLNHILKRCWGMLGVDAVATTPDSSRPHQTDPRNIRRDILFGPSRSGSYLILMSIGVCVVALRALVKFRRK